MSMTRSTSAPSRAWHSEYWDSIFRIQSARSSSVLQTTKSGHLTSRPLSTTGFTRWILPAQDVTSSVNTLIAQASIIARNVREQTLRIFQIPSVGVEFVGELPDSSSVVVAVDVLLIDHRLCACGNFVQPLHAVPNGTARPSQPHRYPTEQQVQGQTAKQPGSTLCNRTDRNLCSVGYR